MNGTGAGSAGGDGERGGYRRLKVWETSFELAVAVFRLADTFPQGTALSLSAQVRIAALSVPSYIARGLSRASRREFLRTLYLAQGALSELETSLSLCAELGYGSEPARRRVESLLRDVRGMTASLIRRLRAAAGLDLSGSGIAGRTSGAGGGESSVP